MTNIVGGARGVRLAILASASLIGLAAAAPGFAQDIAAQEKAAGEETGESIIITGSRIQLSPGMSTPQPVTAVQVDEIKSMAPNTLVEGLSQLPQFYGNGTPQGNNFFGSGSTGSLNLRGLGANRTLVLLNGRRMTAATAFGGVDITNFPESLVKNIQTVTGGASAAYGTDAVAGVTNFILDTKFTGIKAQAQAGATTRGDAVNFDVSLTAGFKIGDRGHFIVSGEMFQEEGVHSYAGRDWYQSWGTITDASGIFYIAPKVVSTSASYDGIVSVAKSSPLYGYQFNRDGSASQFNLAAPGQVSFAAPTAAVVGGGGNARQSIVNGGSGQDLGGGEVNTLQPDFERSSVFAYGDYEIADNFTVFAQYIRGRKTTSSYNTPRALLTGGPTFANIYADNAYLPDNIRQIMASNNIASFQLNRFGSVLDLAANYKISDETVLNSGTAGYDWDIANDGGWFDGWHVEGSYQYGESKRTAYQIGLRVDRIYAALDAVKDPASGNAVCRVSLSAAGRAAFPGCQPLNLFGAGRASPAGIDYVIGYDPGQKITTPLFFANGGLTGETDSYVSEEAKVNIMKVRQQIAELSVNGELFKGWGAGPITVALGGAWRKETIHQVVRDPGNKTSDHTLGAGRTAFPCLSAADAAAAGLRGQPAGGDCANTVFIQFSKVSNIAGSISVKEAFGEVLVPVLANTPFFESLTVDLAGRWANYTGSGSVWAYKGGVNWTIGSGFRLRGTYSRDVRAANLSERYDVTGGAAVVNDLMFVDTANPNGRPTSITRFSGGNPDVRPELADTLTAGAVFQPEFVPGFSVSLDWYRVKIKDAIGQVGTQNVADYCFKGDASYCRLVTRDPTTQTLLLVGDVFVNIAQAVVSGVDLEASYRRSVNILGGDESISARGFASWLTERSDTGATGIKTDRAGQTGIEQTTGVGYALPKFKLTSNTTYRNGPVSIFVQGRFISAGTNQNNPTLTSATAPIPNASTISHNRVPSVYYVDLRLGYSVTLGGKDAELFVNFTNLLDKDPPLTPYWAAFGNNSVQTNGGLFDTLGRRFVVGAKVTL